MAAASVSVNLGSLVKEEAICWIKNCWKAGESACWIEFLALSLNPDWIKSSVTVGHDEDLMDENE